MEENCVTEYSFRFTYNSKSYLIFSNKNQTVINFFSEKDSFQKLFEINKFINFKVKNNKIDISFALRLLNLKVFS